MGLENFIGRRIKYYSPKYQTPDDWTKEQILRWQEHLGFCSEKVVRETLKSTTQMVLVEDDNPTFSHLQRHLKKRFPNLFGRHIKDVAFCDLIVLPKEGN